MRSKFELFSEYYINEYREVYKSEIKVQQALKEALEVALDVRKFEIELYWKRANYFWVFISISFVAFFTLLLSENIDDYLISLVIVSFIGTMFSFSWYLVNRGSKYWQNNWEHHVDMLENVKIGPLYKLTIDNKNSRFNPLKAFPFSVSRINIYVSFYIFVLWMLLSLYSTMLYFGISITAHKHFFYYFLLTLTAFSLILLFFGMDSKNKVDDVFFKRRDKEN